MRLKLWSREQGLVKPPDVLLYAEPGGHVFPEAFRNRVRHWGVNAFHRLQWGTSMGDVVNHVEDSWEMLYLQLCAAYGRQPLVDPADIGRKVHSLADARGVNQIPAHLSRCPDNEVIDFIDAVFQISAYLVERSGGADPVEEPRELGASINEIFEQEGVGYRWVEGQIIRFDEPITHEETIKPTIELLRQVRYGAANDEFSSALDAYRAGRWRDAITNANAAFESVLKIRTGKPNLVGGDLIREARRQGIISGYLEGTVEHLEKLMHSVPAVRGQESAHGMGEREPAAGQSLAQLVISLAASFILYIGRDETP